MVLTYDNTLSQYIFLIFFRAFEKVRSDLRVETELCITLTQIFTISLHRRFQCILKYNLNIRHLRARFLKKSDILIHA